MHIRPAGSADLPRIERIVHAAYARYIPRIGKPLGPMDDDNAGSIRSGRG